MVLLVLSDLSGDGLRSRAGTHEKPRLRGMETQTTSVIEAAKQCCRERPTACLSTANRRVVSCKRHVATAAVQRCASQDAAVVLAAARLELTTHADIGSRPPDPCMMRVIKEFKFATDARRILLAHQDLAGEVGLHGAGRYGAATREVGRDAFSIHRKVIKLCFQVLQVQSCGCHKWW